MAPALMAHPDLRHPNDHVDLTPGDGATVIAGDRTIDIERVLPGDGLWVPSTDVTRVTGFELKPEGACLGELCVPLPGALLQEVDDTTWLDLAGFADHMGQAWVRDADTNTWSFGELPAKRQSTLQDAQAPDLELVDRKGEVIRLADLRGKKTLVITWSSW